MQLFSSPKNRTMRGPGVPRRVEWIRITSMFLLFTPTVRRAALAQLVCMTLSHYWTLSSLESSFELFSKTPKRYDARVRARRPHEKPNVDHATPSSPLLPEPSTALLGVKASSRTFFLSGYKFLIFLAPKFKCFCMIKPNVDHATATEGQGQPSMEWWPFLIAGLLLAFLLNFWNFGLIHICFNGLSVLIVTQLCYTGHYN